MGYISGDAWARRVFGEHGPRLRGLIPRLVSSAHHDMADAQEISHLDAQLVYGGVWRRTLDEFAKVIPNVIPGTALIKPRYASYRIVAVNGVPLYPWRYGKDLIVDPATVKLGNPPSDTRISIFTGAALGAEQLVLDLGPPGFDPADPEPQDDLSAAESILAELTDSAPVVVVVQYASNPYQLLRVRWGDARLRPDGTVTGDFAEDLDLADGAWPGHVTDAAVGEARRRPGPRSTRFGGTLGNAPVRDLPLRP